MHKLKIICRNVSRLNDSFVYSLLSSLLVNNNYFIYTYKSESSTLKTNRLNFLLARILGSMESIEECFYKRFFLQKKKYILQKKNDRKIIDLD